MNLDLKDNKLADLNDEIFLLQELKSLDLSNNDLQSLPYELGLIKSLVKILIDGNPLKGIRMGIRQGGSGALKKYLVDRINWSEHEQKKVQKWGKSDADGQETPQKGDQLTDAGRTPEKIDDIKAAMINEEFFGGVTTGDETWTQLLRDYLNSNGDLRYIFVFFIINRLVQKGLTEISSVLLTVENLKGLDLTQNKISLIPEFVAKLQYLRFLHLGDNQICDFPLEII